MLSGSNIALAIAGLTLLLAILLVTRADITRVREGRVLAFVGLFLLPSMAVWAGVSQHMERAKTTEFCLSCHTMEDYGRSLHVNDKSHLPRRTIEQLGATRRGLLHVSYRLHHVRRSKDKWRGSFHVYVQYLDTGNGEIKLASRSTTGVPAPSCRRGRLWNRPSEESRPDREGNHQSDVLHVEPLSRHHS
jgi:hypothetical protein